MPYRHNGARLFQKILGLRLTCFLWLITFVANVQAESYATVTDRNTLSFGVVPQQSATTLAGLWTPVLEKLSAATGYRVEFKTAPDIPEFERRLARGEYDLAYMNPYHYTVFHEHPGYRAFAKEKDILLKGILVVRSDSPYKELGDLANKTLAFPSPAAFAASMITRANLQSRSIPFEAKYVSSHDSVYRSIAKGLYAAGGGVTRTFNAMNNETRAQLRVLWMSPGYTPHAFAAHPRLDSVVLDKIQTGIVDLSNTEEGKALLAKLNFHGITYASDGEWNDIRSMNLQSLPDLIPVASQH